MTVPLAPTAPGVFSLSANGLGPAAIRHADGSTVTQTSPAMPGEMVEIYLTGLGAVNPPVPDGTAAPGQPYALATAPVTVFVGGIQVSNIPFQGLSPGTASLYQLNIQIPSTVGPGAQPLEVQTAAGSPILWMSGSPSHSIAKTWDSGGHEADRYFPIQNVEKMRFKMSSAVVAPVIASMGRRAAYRSSSNISCGMPRPTA